jgi:ribbon-helix-helix CopG family protein
MTDLTLSDELVEKIRKLAQREQRTVEDVVTDMLHQYHPVGQSLPLSHDETPHPDPLVGLIGLLDDDIQKTDMSSTVRETLKQHTHPQYG